MFTWMAIVGNKLGWKDLYKILHNILTEHKVHDTWQQLLKQISSTSTVHPHTRPCPEAALKIKVVYLSMC